MVLKSRNPYTNEVIEEFKPLTYKETEKKIRQSKKAFKEWKCSNFEYRKKLVLKAADLLRKSKEVLSKHITMEMGKTKSEAVAEVEKCAWVCEYYAPEAEIMLHREAVATEAHIAFIEYEPLGPVLGIMPWNFPFWQVFRFMIPTLLAGNVVLLKHASNTQISARAIENIMEHAGFPPGVFQNLTITSDEVENVIEHDAVKAVTITGSEEAGRKVAQIAAANIKKTVLELGGSNAFIVLEDADIEQAVEIGIKARMQNAGQSCIAAKRFIIHEKVIDEFIDRYAAEMKKLKTGDPLDEETDIGPLVNNKQAEKVKEQVRKSVEIGAEIVEGDLPKDAVYPPTLVKNVTPGMPLFDEEVFGPVAAVISAKDVEEAVKLSNRSKYGLGVSVFTNDLDRAENLVPHFDDGAVFINALVKSDPRLPFGGTKKSGYGRELALQGIREFVNVKTVYIDKFGDVDKDEGDSAISIG